MQKQFAELRERLLRAGVAPRHVRRYLRELADHLADLRVEEEQAGRGEMDAEEAALERLGGVKELADAMIAKPELRAWSARAPWVVFGIGSVAWVAAAYAAACTILWTGWRIFLPGSESPFVPINGAAAIYFGVGRMLYWGAPVLVGWSMCVLAARQRMKAKWPAVGMAAAALIAALVQVHARRPDSNGGWGQVSLGMAVGPTAGALLAQLAYAAVLFTVALLPYALWLLRRERAAQGSA
jgi:hypothetical protein